MKALVLAAGKGTRLGAAAGGVPKPLIDLGGISPLEHSIAWVVGVQPSCIWINLHEGAEQIRQRIGSSVVGVPVRYSYEPELLGSAGAWKKLEAEWEETSLVVYGDNYMRFDLDALHATHRAAGALVTIAVFDPLVHANTGSGGGHVRLDGERVRAFAEGGSGGLISAGVYLIEPALSERLPVGTSDFGYAVLPALAAAGLLAAHRVEDSAYCLGIDTPERLALARRLLATPELVS